MLSNQRTIIGLAIVILVIFLVATHLDNSIEANPKEGLANRGCDTYHWRRYAARLNAPPEEAGLAAYTHDPNDELMDAIAAADVSLGPLEGKGHDWDQYISFCGLAGMEKRGLYGAATSRSGRVRVVYPRYDPDLPRDVAITPRVIKIAAPKSARAALYANKMGDIVGIPQDSSAGPSPEPRVIISKYTYKDH